MDQKDKSLTSATSTRQDSAGDLVDNFETQRIDIDELEVRILIVAKNPKTVEPAVQFITRRGWPTRIVSDLSKAIQLIVSDKPDLILFSINHPSPKISKLPMILSQSLNANCVVFAEGMDTRSQAVLTSSKVRHKIVGTPSGPNLHRGIRKILNEIYNPESTSNESAPLEGKIQNSEDGYTRISGDQSGNQDNTHITSRSEVINGGNYKLETKKAKKRLSDLRPPPREVAKSSGVHFQRGVNGSTSLSATDLMALLQNEDDIEATESSPLQNFKGLESKQSKSQTKRNSQQHHQSGKNKTSNQTLDQKSKEVLKEALSIFLEKKKDYFDASLPVASLGIVMLASMEFKGYFVVGFTEPSPSSEVLKDFQTFITQLLLKQKLTTHVEAGFTMSVEDVLLEEWFEADAEDSWLIEQGVHCARAGVFSYYNNLDPKTKDIQNSMLTIDVSLLDEDSTVPFKTYLHLRRNGKYYKYLNEGRKIQSRQKQKLETSKVDVRIKKKDLPRFKMYCLTLEIKNRLKAFKAAVAAA